VYLDVAKIDSHLVALKRNTQASNYNESI